MCTGFYFSAPILQHSPRSYSSIILEYGNNVNSLMVPLKKEADVLTSADKIKESWDEYCTSSIIGYLECHVFRTRTVCSSENGTESYFSGIITAYVLAVQYTVCSHTVEMYSKAQQSA